MSALVYLMSTGLLGDLELHGSLGLLLHDDGSGGNAVTMRYIAYPKFHQVAGP